MSAYCLPLSGGRFDGGAFIVEADAARQARYVLVECEEGPFTKSDPPSTLDGAKALFFRKKPRKSDLAHPGCYVRCSDGVFRPPKRKGAKGA